MPPTLVLPIATGIALVSGYGYLIWLVVLGILMWRRASQAMPLQRLAEAV